MANPTGELGNMQNGIPSNYVEKKTRKIDLYTEPGDLNLHCPFCGTQVYDCTKKEPAAGCGHTKFAGAGSWDEVKHMADDDDLCFMSYESDSPNDEYVFLFREPEKPDSY